MYTMHSGCPLLPMLSYVPPTPPKVTSSLPVPFPDSWHLGHLSHHWIGTLTWSPMTSPVGTHLRAMVFPPPESICSKQFSSEGRGALSLNPHLRLGGWCLHLCADNHTCWESIVTIVYSPKGNIWWPLFLSSDSYILFTGSFSVFLVTKKRMV